MVADLELPSHGEPSILSSGKFPYPPRLLKMVSIWGLDYECDTCDRDFGGRQAAIQHMNALNHWRPRHNYNTYNRRFGSRQAGIQIMGALNHSSPRYMCDACNRAFLLGGHWTGTWMIQDTTSLHSSARPATEDSNTMSATKSTLQALNQHLNSPAHSEKLYDCPNRSCNYVR